MSPPSSLPSLKLRLTSTLSRKQEPFTPLSPEGVRMYHCGPTVMEPVNIDKFRSYLLGDVLRRYLEYQGLLVRQVMNITDVGHLNEFEEDAVEITASRSGLYAWELVEQEEKAFHQDRRALNILDAHVYPRAREHVPEMIEFIEKLLEAGAAYRVGGHVYFDMGKARSLGRLSGKAREELESLKEKALAASRAGSSAPEKRHPLDFDLWRPDALHQIHWSSPWGRGFPGWHVECVVMSRKYLGTTFDIHSGSEENIFPHHECEIAQAEAAGGEPLARLWLHSRHVLLAGKPISRPNRNLLTVRGLVETGEIRGPEIRGALLSARFREPLEFRPEAVDEAREAIALLRGFRDHHRTGPPGAPPTDALRDRIARAEREFTEAMDDDLDVPRALGAVRRISKDLASVAPCREAAAAVDRFDRVLGLL